MVASSVRNRSDAESHTRAMEIHTRPYPDIFSFPATDFTREHLNRIEMPWFVDPPHERPTSLIVNSELTPPPVFSGRLRSFPLGPTRLSARQ